MPLAAITLTENIMFCVHGGIGKTFFNLAELEELKRPVIIT